MSSAGGSTSDLRVVPLTHRELPLCESLWPDRPAFTNEEFSQALRTVERLLSERRIFGRAVMEGGRLRAYGISGFVHEQFADEYVASPHPQMGKKLLLEAPTRTILSVAEIAERNAGAGLQLVVPSANFDATSSDSMSVLGALMGAYLEAHRGYRIKRMVQEAIGEGARVVVTQGDSEVIRLFEEIAPGIPIPSVAVTMDRDYAAARKSPFLSLFVYGPPRVLFTRAEQELLLAAVDGAPDAVISERLGTAVSSVKARWNRIYERAAERLPHLFEQLAAPATHGGRGRQIRHVILQYVRENPSELTPYRRSHHHPRVPAAGPRTTTSVSQ